MTNPPAGSSNPATRRKSRPQFRPTALLASEPLVPRLASEGSRAARSTRTSRMWSISADRRRGNQGNGAKRPSRAATDLHRQGDDPRTHLGHLIEGGEILQAGHTG